MKILHIITSSNFGGAEQYLLHLLSEQKRQHHDLYLYRHPFGRRDRDVEKFVCRDVKVSIKNSVSPYHLRQIVSLIKRAKIDVIHTHLSKASVLGGIAGKCSGTPVIATVHGVNSRKDYHFSSAVIAVSEAVKEALLEKRPWNKKIYVIHNGIPDPVQCKKTFLANGSLKILFAGRLTYEKGVDRLLTLLSRYQMKPWTLTIAGTGPMEKELKEKCAELELTGNVFFTGFVDDIGSLMLEHDCLVLPSRKEGFGLVLIEAFARGIPALGANTGGITEIIGPNSGGLLFNPDSPESLYKTLDELSQRNRLSALGKMAYQTYQNKFTLEKMGKSIEAVYESFL
ncbi:MAG TPA: glycosyltransferase family 1 protein [Firmicutes bacterium]|nr:glycosyltransferase family 1 protein [Bacillota bacterium]